MRFLKKKIALARCFYASKAQEREENVKKQFSHNERSSLKLISAPESYKATKNVVKNYGRAISSFALSNLALPYLDTILQRENLSLEQFTRYLKQIRGSIDGLTHFRSTLLIGREDDDHIAASKRAFIAISEVFIKYFSVNWIYNSRIFHKEAHLKFRFKMLRRVQNPELFTYLKKKN